MAALPGPSLDGGRGGAARRTEADTEKAPREVILEDPCGSGSGGGGGGRLRRGGEGVRVRGAGGEEAGDGEAPAARGCGHRPGPLGSSWARGPWACLYKEGKKTQKVPVLICTYGKQKFPKKTFGEKYCTYGYLTKF